MQYIGKYLYKFSYSLPEPGQKKAAADKEENSGGNKKYMEEI
jgi:hypothetical protein